MIDEDQLKLGLPSYSFEHVLDANPSVDLSQDRKVSEELAWLISSNKNIKSPPSPASKQQFDLGNLRKQIKKVDKVVRQHRKLKSQLRSLVRRHQCLLQTVQELKQSMHEKVKQGIKRQLRRMQRPNRRNTRQVRKRTLK